MRREEGVDTYSDDAVFVGDYVFWDFVQEKSPIVYFQYKRRTGGDVVQPEIVALFKKMGLWEDYINIQKTVKEEVEGGPSQTLNTFNRPNQFDVDFCKAEAGYPRIPICVVSLTREESLRLSNGQSESVDLEIEELKNRLIGVHKWIELHARRDAREYSKWEYKFLASVGKENWNESQEIFTAMGDKGWEFITFMDDLHLIEEARLKGEEPSLNVRLFIFKRPVYKEGS